jgi:hypothetical protein
MPEDIRAWYGTTLSDRYELVARGEGIWAVFVDEHRVPGADHGVLTVSHWDGASFIADEIAAPAFQDCAIPIEADYVDVEVDATVPCRTGVSGVTRSLRLDGTYPRAAQSLEFRLVLGERSTLAVFRQRPGGRTIVLQIRPALASVRT